MKTLVRFLLVGFLVLASHGTAHAQKSWNVTTGSWAGTNNWTPSGVPTASDNVSIANGGTATLAASGAVFGTLSIGSNSALIKTSAGSFTIFQNSPPASPVINAGLISVSSGTMTLGHQTTGTNFAITNTGGVMRATGGGVFAFTRNSAYAFTGGTIDIGVGSMLDQYKIMTLTNVNYSNSGTTQTKTDGNQVNTTFQLSGTSSFNNTGVLAVINQNNDTVTAKTTKFVVDSTASLTNASTGVINIRRDLPTSGTNVTVAHEAFLQLDAAGFTNQGAINITSTNSQVGTAQFRASSVDFSNAGAITVNGSRSSIEMGSRTFTQTAGSLSLVNGGRITAGSVLINSGTLLGTGTIAAPVTIGGILSPGSGGIGTLSVSNGVTWNAGNAWKFELGTAAQSLAAAVSGSSTGDLLALTGAFGQGSGSDFTFDFASSGTDGWYKLVDYASTTFATGTNAAFKATNLPAGKTANFVVDSSSTALYVQIVPEPGTIALAGVGAAFAALMYRKRRWDR